MLDKLPFEIIAIIFNFLAVKDVNSAMLSARRLWKSCYLRNYCRKIVIHLNREQNYGLKSERRSFPERRTNITLFSLDIHISLYEFFNLVVDCAEGRADSLINEPERIAALTISGDIIPDEKLTIFDFMNNKEIQQENNINESDTNKMRTFFKETYKHLKKLCLSGINFTIEHENWQRDFSIATGMIDGIESLTIHHCCLSLARLPKSVKTLAIMYSDYTNLDVSSNVTDLIVVNSSFNATEICSMKNLKILALRDIVLYANQIQLLLSIDNVFDIECVLSSRKNPSKSFCSCARDDLADFIIRKKGNTLTLRLSNKFPIRYVGHTWELAQLLQPELKDKKMFVDHPYEVILIAYKEETREQVLLEYARFILSEIVLFLGVPDTKIEITSL